MKERKEDKEEETEIERDNHSYRLISGFHVIVVVYFS